MGSCSCCAKAGDTENEEGNKFQSGGANDLSSGPAKNRSCTDIIFIPLFIAAQAIFVVVTIAGMADGDPSKLYKPRDFMGAYCGAEANWNGGPNTVDAPKLSYTMNLTSVVDVMMKQTVCSSLAKTVLVDGSSGVQPLLENQTDRDKYLCDCCLTPCDRCDGSLDNGGDLSLDSLSSAITGRMSELTNPSMATSLFSPSGANADMFSTSAFWEEATKYFNTVCLPDCTVNSGTMNASNLTSRPYTYSPAQDDALYGVWNLLKNADGNDPSTTALMTTISNAFKFEALPYSSCPYDPSRCVPMPGITFGDLGADYCTFEFASDVVDAVGSVAASAFESIGGTAISSAATETFGKWAGDLQVALDTFIIVCVLSFVVGLVFLVVLRFLVGLCVWIAVACTVLMFFFGGAFVFVLSAQCEGASIFETGEQVGVAIVVAGTTTASNIVNGVDAISEDMTGDGADYRGVQRYTKNGRACMPWDQQAVMSRYNSTNFNESGLVHAYCRNPYHPDAANKAKTIWCVTSDPDMPWEECIPIGIITPGCSSGYAIASESMRDVLYYSSFVVWGLGVLWILVIFCLMSRIRLAIALNKVAAVFLGSNPHILLVPIFQAVAAIIWVTIWLCGASYLLSQVPADYTPTGSYETYQEAYGTQSTCAFWEFSDSCSGTPGACNDRWPTGSVWKDSECDEVDGISKCWRCAPPRYALDWRFAISFFVFLWNNAFNVALGQILIAMAVGIWFFSAEKGKTPIVGRAVKTIFRYHLGSVAFGSFIVAVVQFIRYLMKYFEKQASAQKNRLMVYVLKAIQCCIWCFEKCIKFLNKNAYIQIALLGKNFCTSAKKAFFLILRNAVRFGTMAALSGIIHCIGFIFIMTGTAVVGYFLMREMHPEISPFMPMVCFLFVSYVVSKLYMNVFGLAVDTALQCFLAVEEMGTCQEYVPSVLANFVKSGGRSTEPTSDT